jgi:hypothetical protein
VRSIDERQRRVVSLVGSDGSTAYDIAKNLFAASFDADVHRFLAISEAIAHLDYAHSEHKIDLELKDGIEYYRPH